MAQAKTVAPTVMAIMDSMTYTFSFAMIHYDVKRLRHNGETAVIFVFYYKITLFKENGHKYAIICSNYQGFMVTFELEK